MTKEQLLNLFKVIEEIKTYNDSDEQIADWLLKPNEELFNASPYEMLISVNPKDGQKVLELLG